MRNAGLEETQAGIKIAGRNINHLRYADDTTLMAKQPQHLKLKAVGKRGVFRAQEPGPPAMVDTAHWG